MVTLLAPAGSLRAGARLVLDTDQRHHARVRRLAAGDRVRLVDGAGAVAAGTVAELTSSVAVDLEEVDRTERPPPTTLAVGAGDRDRFAWMVEKATELGVTDIVPLVTERTAGVATGVRAGHLDRLRARAAEALKQCGAAWLPTVRAPVALTAWLEELSGGLRWVAAPGGVAPSGTEIAPREAVHVAVGPEGGFTEDEEALLAGHGFTPVALGRYVLRFETAALAAAAAVAAWRGATDEGRPR